MKRLLLLAALLAGASVPAQTPTIDDTQRAQQTLDAANALKATDASIPSPKPPPPEPLPRPAGTPTSAEFVRLAVDPRGGDNAYNMLPRLPDGRLVLFRGFSHLETTSNAVGYYDPKANAGTIVRPHTPFVLKPDVSGLTFLGNSDNGMAHVVGDEVRFYQGQRGSSPKGNHRGAWNWKTNAWSLVDDTGGAWGGFLWPAGNLNGAFGTIGGRLYAFGGERSGAPTDALSLQEITTGKITTFANPWGNAAFAGAERLDQIASQHFVRGSSVFVYGGSWIARGASARASSNVLWELNLADPSKPVMAAYATNALVNAPVGPGIIAVHDPARDLVIITNGKAVNVFDFATKTFANVPLRAAPPNDAHSPSDQGAPRAGVWSPEIAQVVILGGRSNIYGLRVTATGTPVPASAGPRSPSPVPPVQPAHSPPSGSPGALKLVTTAVPYVGPMRAFGSAKHLDFARLGDRWYKCAGDHPAIDPKGAAIQSGRQEIVSFNVARNDARLDQGYYILDPAQVQPSLPDDAFCMARGDELYLFISARTAVPNQPTGIAQQLDAVMAYKPGRGWRKVTDNIAEWRANRAFRGMYDAKTDRFLVPAEISGLVWVVMDGAGKDLTPRSSTGEPVRWGNHSINIAGLAVDEANRKAYGYDYVVPGLTVTDVDTLKTSRLPVVIPEPAASRQAAIKVAWHPDLRAVIIAASKMHAYEVDSGKLTTWDRTDGFVSPVSKQRIPTSALFFDPDTRDVVSIGTLDWGNAALHPNYWRLTITK